MTIGVAPPASPQPPPTPPPRSTASEDGTAGAAPLQLQLRTTDPHAGIAAAVLLLPGLPPPHPADSYGVHRLTASWLRAAHSRSPHTAKAYFRDLNRFLTWCANRSQPATDPAGPDVVDNRNDPGPAPETLGGRRLDPLDLRPVDLVDYSTDLQRDLAPSSAHRALAAASSWYRFLLANGVVDANPLAAVPRPTVDQDSTTAGLTEQEIDALLNAADAVAVARGIPLASTPTAGRVRRHLAALRDRALLRLLADLGVRIGEALALNLDALSTQRGHRTVRYQGKGKKIRERPLGAHVLEALDDYLAARAALTGVAVTALTGPLLATHTDAGEPGRLDEPAAFRTVRRLARYAGIAAVDRLSPHSLRHAFATAADEAGIPLEHVQDAMGHADPRTTRRYNRRRHILENDPGLKLAARRAGRQAAAGEAARTAAAAGPDGTAA